MTEASPEAPSSSPAPPLTALVFAGGAARRMGGEKCGQTFEGRPLLGRVLELADAVADEVLLLAGAREVAVEVEVDARRVADWPDAPGPLGALGAGLEAATHDWCLALPCDMPRVSVAVVRRLLGLAPTTPAAVVVAGPSGREPFCALYHRALLPELRAVLAEGTASLKGWLDACASRDRLVEVPAESFRAVDPDLAFLHNVNTPADLRPVSPSHHETRPSP